MRKRRTTQSRQYILSIHIVSATHEDIDADESNSGSLRSQVGRSRYSPGNGDDELTDCHAYCAEEQEVPTAQLFHQIQPWESRDHIHDADKMLACSLKVANQVLEYGSRSGNSLGDDRDDERVAEACILEVLSAIVEDEVLAYGQLAILRPSVITVLTTPVSC